MGISISLRQHRCIERGPIHCTFSPLEYMQVRSNFLLVDVLPGNWRCEHPSSVIFLDVGRRQVHHWFQTDHTLLELVSDSETQTGRPHTIVRATTDFASEELIVYDCIFRCFRLLWEILWLACLSDILTITGNKKDKQRCFSGTLEIFLESGGVGIFFSFGIRRCWNINQSNICRWITAGPYLS